MCSVHLVFHVSMLEPASLNTIPSRTQSPPPPVQVDGDLEYEISQIDNSKLNLRTRSKLKYYVKWMGYEGTAKEYSWLDATDLNAPELISSFHEQNPDKFGPLEKVKEQIKNLKEKENVKEKTKSRNSHILSILSKP